jgi:methylenetetrahydrofolate dehydrogenase (NADP+)/methenyltetrahydrofolate cyclohydrolase
MILDGKLVAQNLDNYTLEKINQNKDFYNWKYVAFLLFEDDLASRAYISMKKKKAEKFWLWTKVIEDTKLDDYQKAIKIIDELNQDDDCIWILVQLPINEKLKPYQGKILANINPKKDIDGLWWVLFGLSQIDAIYFLPATVRAIFEILYFYKISVSWKNVAILWQSNLIWKPTATECMRQQATVFSFNSFSNIEDIKNICKISDIIISATWQLQLIDSSFLSNKKMQVLIDVGWGKKDSKAVWDFDFTKINLENYMYTPVPGGVWPVTVSSIFANLVDLQEIL